jgi:hypothetical protein
VISVLKLRAIEKPFAVSSVDLFNGIPPPRSHIMSNESKHDKARDRTVEAGFPASDPPAASGITGADTPSDQRDVDAIPTGYPTSDRHGAETAHQWEHEEKGIDAAKDLSNDGSEARTRSSSHP